MRRLPPGGHVLDLGCGAGHYSRLLRDAGFRLTLVDGSSAGLAAEAEARTGLPVRVQLFQDFNDPPAYDGIWACASLLHVPESRTAGRVRARGRVAETRRAALLLVQGNRRPGRQARTALRGDECRPPLEILAAKRPRMLRGVRRRQRRL
ncbi:MAG: class I SAM-dependent methyltransferase [Brucellaceae bacterium]|nr:class I SAM-dependent methyltransferase [Brucellaceae bacterium]